MADTTAISWTDHTFNPWQGCERVSPGCDNCYAEAISRRVGHPERWAGERAVTSDNYWRNPLKWDRAAAEAGRPALVFCASMADVFEDHPGVADARQRLFELIEQTPNLIWQLLTKRPENVLRLVPRRWLPGTEEGCTGCGEFPLDHEWPSNVWIGCTVEDQQRADERIPHLLQVPAPVRFLSCEPLLGPLELSRWLAARCECMDSGPSYTNVGNPHHDGSPDECPDCFMGVKFSGIGWIIAGAESRGSRPGRQALMEWFRSLRDQAQNAGIPFLLKQADVNGRIEHLPELDGRRWAEFPPEARRG